MTDRTGIIEPPERIHRESARVQSNTPAGAGIGGIMLTAAGTTIIGAVVRGAIDNDKAWMVAWFGGLFAVAGLLVLSASIRAVFWRRRLRAVEAKGPWLADYPWNPRGTGDNAWGRARHGVIAVAAITLFMVPFHGLFLSGANTNAAARAVAWLFFGVFDLIILLACWHVVTLVMKAIKFGARHVEYPAFPMRTGEELAIRFTGGARLARLADLKAELVCVQERYEVTYVGRKQNRTLVHECLYRETIAFSTDAQGMGVLKFHPPADAPSTDFAATPPRYWEVEVKAEVPGLDYQGLFAVPVYSTATRAVPSMTTVVG